MEKVGMPHGVLYHNPSQNQVSSPKRTLCLLFPETVSTGRLVSEPSYSTKDPSFTWRALTEFPGLSFTQDSHFSL